MYEMLKNEFERLEERGNENSSSTSSIASSVSSAASAIVTKFRSSSPSSLSPSSSPQKTPNIIDKFSSHICGQLLLYIKARLDMIAIYEKIVQISSQKFCIFDELVNNLDEIVDSNQNKFHHPLLAAMKSSFTFECEILSNLMRAYVDIQHYRFLKSLFSIQEAQTKLVTWSNSTLKNDSPKRKVLIKSSSLPPLYDWLHKFKSILMSKFSLYYYSILSKQTNPTDFKAVCTKQTNDYLYKISTFHKKAKAHCVCIIFDSIGEDYNGPGYCSPFTSHHPPSGIDSYPLIFSYPIERPTNHIPALIMILNSKSKPLNESDSVVYFYDNQLKSTYFLSRPDPKMTLIVIFESEKSQKDSNVISFLQEFCTFLKCNKFFITLKSEGK